MPPRSFRKRPAVEAYDEDGGFVVGEGSGEETGARAGKKVKTAGVTRHSKVVAKSGDVGQYWELSDKRRVTIEEYGGKTLVSIREFYEKDGEMLPGKKVSACVGYGFPL